MAARKKDKRPAKATAKKYAVIYDTDLEIHDTLEEAKSVARNWTDDDGGGTTVVEVLAYFRTTSSVREEAP